MSSSVEPTPPPIKPLRVLAEYRESSVGAGPLLLAVLSLPLKPPRDTPPLPLPIRLKPKTFHTILNTSNKPRTYESRHSASDGREVLVELWAHTGGITKIIGTSSLENFGYKNFWFLPFKRYRISARGFGDLLY